MTTPAYSLSGFRLYDALVIVEPIVGEQQLAEADDVARYDVQVRCARRRLRPRIVLHRCV
jgi:hypothetical protein